MRRRFVFLTVFLPLGASLGSSQCPPAQKYGNGPPPLSNCTLPTDPKNLPPSKLEEWFTRDMFYDLFPKANIGWGPNTCWPYSYEAFVIAARYFPEFGTSSPNTVYTAAQNYRRDVGAFFSHAIQETGENNIGLYDGRRSTQEADNCFYRGGFYNWFEGGPTSAFLKPSAPGWDPKDGNECNFAGKYCSQAPDISYFYNCSEKTAPDAGYYTGCYFGRGAIQISYNYNYGAFQNWLKTKNITVDLLNNPNVVMTSMNPPLAIMASLWFYMTPQPPKPSMHDIVLGSWNAGPVNTAAGYSGAIFGPTSLIINNECNGEDAATPGGPGESRRIKAFKWFCNYFDVPVESANLLSCKNMPQRFSTMKYNISWQPNWATAWKNAPCECAPASYGGMVPYFDPAYYSPQFVAQNAANQKICAGSIYGNPAMYNMNPDSSACLKFPPN